MPPLRKKVAKNVFIPLKELNSPPYVGSHSNSFLTLQSDIFLTHFFQGGNPPDDV